MFCATGAWQIHQHFNDERKMNPCQKASDGYQGLGHVIASYLPVMRNIKEHKFVKIDRWFILSLEPLLDYFCGFFNPWKELNNESHILKLEFDFKKRRAILKVWFLTYQRSHICCSALQFQWMKGLIGFLSTNIFLAYTGKYYEAFFAVLRVAVL